ncbi:MAG: TonB-dependent receptor [Bryobacterales bacterium]|nr:TonB-dependent receptor [Bryobacterales bacterium]
MHRLTLLILATLSLHAQTFTARLSGTVKDPTGAPIPDAKVSLTQLETNASKSTQTGESGTFFLPLLLPGNYEIAVEKQGFQLLKQAGIKLEVNQNATLDVSLKLADTATSVDVSAEVPVLQTETGGVGLTLETKTIEEFPLAERNIMALVRTVPGVIARDQVGQSRGGRNVFDSNFSVGGGRTSTNEVLLDGSTNTIGDFNGVVINPPPDSVQEIRVETNAFSAEFGRTGGGVVNVVTKAGTNSYHGAAYYYHQNDAFNANSFVNNRFNTPKPVLRRHQYGFTLGGPLWIPKLYKGANQTFFFTAFEGRREKDPVQSVQSVPTALERAGDFSSTVFLAAAGPQSIQVFDPSTSRVSGNTRSRDPFPGNIVPASRINPIAARLTAFYPEPNRAGSTVTGRQNYLYEASRTYSRDLFTNRVDHYFNGKHRLFGRFSWQENLDTNPATIVRFTNSNSVYDRFANVAIDDTYQFTPRLYNVFRYMFARFRANQISNTLGYDPTQLGLPAYIRDSANILFFPNVTNNEFPSLGGTAHNDQPRDTQGIQNNIVYTRGKHNLRAGAEYRLYRFYPFQIFNPTGLYAFTKQHTAPDQLASVAPQFGLGFASMLLGFGGFQYEKVEPLTAYHHYAGAYLQDDFKVTARLTLNAGLRWETETGTGESHDRLSYFDPNYPSPLRGAPPGAILFTGDANPRTVRANNYRNFAPRLGAAYRINSKTALRAGYGIFFLPLGLEPTIVTTPFNYTVIADAFTPTYSPRVTLSDPFPGGIARPSSADRVTGGSYRLGANSNIVLRHQPAHYVQQWNFAIGRQLAWHTVIDATYWGTRGIHLPIPNLELNQIHPDNLRQGGAWLNERVANPYAGQIRTGLLAQATIPRMQLLKSYPQYANPTTANAYGGSLFYLRPPVGDSIYHAATFRFERRFTKGFSLTAHYTWSKLIDTGGAGNGAAFLDPSALRDIYNVRLERSLGSFDVPHRFVFFYSFTVPYGKGRRFLKSGGAGTLAKTANLVLGGWSVFASNTLQAGAPVAVGGPDLSRLAGASPSRATVVPGVQAKIPLSESIANAKDWDNRCGCTKPWFNPAAFSVTPEFQIPNGPRFLPDVRAAWLRNMDATLMKTFALTDKVRFRLEGQFFNLLNQTTMSGPSVTTVNSANFGSAGGERGAPRTIQIGGRVSF